jgi:heme/copper-type cytochrome/quinol oxidase subunit 1
MSNASRSSLKHFLVRLCVPSLIALVAWFLAQHRYEFVSPLSVFLCIEGTLLLAFVISFPQGPTKLRWWLYESMNYGSTPSFSYVNFYLGLAAIIVGIIVGAVK